MQLGVSSYAFGWAVGVTGFPPPSRFTELDLLTYARDQGVSLVQLGDHLALETFDDARLARLRDSAADAVAPVRLEIGARGLTEAHLTRFIQIAQFLRASLLRFVIDGPHYEPSPAEVVRLLRAFAPRLEQAQLPLGIENHDRFPARELRRMIETVGSEWIGICLDTANSLGAGEGLDHVLAQLGPHTLNLHIKDFSIARLPHAMGFLIEGRPAGGGMLDVAKLRDTLRRQSRCRSAVLEVWTPPEAKLADTLAKERRWADQSLAFLKPIFPTP